MSAQQAAQGPVKWVMNISKDGDSTVLLGSLLQCLITLTLKWNAFLYFNLCLLPPHSILLKRVWLCHLCYLREIMISMNEPGTPPFLCVFVFL